MIALLKKYFFLIAFIIASVLYIKVSVDGYYPLIYFVKPFIVISLLTHYVINAEKIDFIFVLALFSAYLGDLFFSIETEIPYIIAMGFFLLYTLFIMIIVSGRLALIELSKLLLSAIPFMILIFLLVYVFFNNKGSMMSLYYIHGFTSIALGAFSLYYFVKTKNIDGLLFTLGCLFFIAGGTGKGLKLFYEQTIDAKVINIGGYTLSLFFYYLGVVRKPLN